MSTDHLTNYPSAGFVELEGYEQDNLFLTDEMLYHQPVTLQLAEEEYERVLGGATSRLPIPMYEATPPHGGRPQSAPHSSRPSGKVALATFPYQALAAVWGSV